MYILILLLFLSLCGTASLSRKADDVRPIAGALYADGKMVELIAYLDDVEREYSTLILDSEHPSLYSYKGVALYNAQRMKDAEESFLKAVSHTPWDSRSWINIGEIRVQTFNINGAIMAFGKAFKQNDLNALGHLLRAKGWIADWKDFERISAIMEKYAIRCADAHNAVGFGPEEMRAACEGVDGSSGMEYTFLGGEHSKILHALAPNARSQESERLAQNELANVTRSPEQGGEEKSKRLKVGIVSADFGVHPVSSLVRGAINMIDKSKIELYCFSLQDKYSWWGTNISSSAEHFMYLSQVNPLEAAKEVARLGIEILIDLNGHTMFSGLRLMAHKPAPIQLSFLGLPTTTGSSFIDYYLGDRVALPPEHSTHFTESISLLPNCYIVNDYAQLQGDLVQFLSGQRAARKELIGNSKADQTPMLFATLSNTQKLDPTTWHVWMNLMRTFAGSKMVHVHHRGSDEALPHLRRAAVLHGIGAQDVLMVGQIPWIDHLYTKTAVDMILDTGVKNGHTTGLDGLWAGVPTVSFATGITMSTRAAQSIQSSLGVELGLSYSNKDYEDVARRVLRRKLYRPSTTTTAQAEAEEAHDKKEEEEDERHVISQQQQPRLGAWRKTVEDARTTGPLFDTPEWTRNFERQLQVMWDVALLQTKGKRPFQIVLGTGGGAQDENKESSGDDVKTERGHVGRLLLGQAYTPQSRYFPADVGLQRRGADFLYVDGSGATADASTAATGSTDTGTGATGTGGSDREARGRSIGNHVRARLPLPLEPLPASMLNKDYIFLNIGGTEYKDGWYNVNSQRRIGVSSSSASSATGAGWREADVDVVRLMDQLVDVPDNSISALYASHTLEHASFGDGHLEDTLAEWRRVLRPGGLLMLSVPDLRTIFQLYLREGLPPQDKWRLTMMIYGAQSDEYDYHKVGFDETILTVFLRQAGFCRIERTGSFNLFNDTSEIRVSGIPISLNMASYKCETLGAPPQEGFSIEHQADTYVPGSGAFPQEHLCDACDAEAKKGKRG